MKIKKMKHEVEYRTMIGRSQSWEGYVEDEGDAVTEAINESYAGGGSYDHTYHSTIYVTCFEDDFIYEERT